MENSIESGNFLNKIEKEPFEKFTTREFFEKWCKINDSIEPRFVYRQTWEERGKLGIMEKNNQGKMDLYIPYDLKLWEIMDIIRLIDHDTYALKPEKRDTHSEEIKELGQMFENAGIYFNEYIDDIDDGQLIAAEMAFYFYNYGLSLQKGFRVEDAEPGSRKLSEDEKAMVDEWLLGSEVYNNRIARLGKNPTNDQIEATRKRLIHNIFAALDKEGYVKNGEKIWDVQKGPIKKFQDKVIAKTEIAIQTPEDEMKNTIFRRGLEKLVTEIKEPGWKLKVNKFLEKVGFNALFEQKKLYDKLQISKLKEELEFVRRTGVVDAISKKEIEIAYIIQSAVMQYPYNENAHNPSDIIKNQLVNCVGSSVLGGGLLDEVGINYLHMTIPKHSATLLLTSNDKIYWQDFTPALKRIHPPKNVEITGSCLIDSKVSDILNFSKNPKEEGLMIGIKYTDGNEHQILLSKPEIGLQSGILYNAGIKLEQLANSTGEVHDYELAAEAFSQLTSLGQHQSAAFNELGNIHYEVNDIDKSMENYRRAIEISPNDTKSYNGFGNILADSESYDDAIFAYNKQIEIEPDNNNAYYNLSLAYMDIGDNIKAIENLKKCISLCKEHKFAPGVLKELESK